MACKAVKKLLGYELCLMEPEGTLYYSDSIAVIETLSNPQQSWGESCTQVAITKATEKNSVVYYVRV